MCLPTGFLKAYTGVGAGLTILAGLFGIIYSLILLFDNDGTLGLQQDTREALCWGLFGTSFIIFVFGILAMVGIMKRQAVCLVAYNVVIICGMIVFLGIGIAASTSPFHIMDNTCPAAVVNKNTKAVKPWAQNVQNLVNQANTTFCQQSCPCYMNPSGFKKYSTTYQQQLYAQLPWMSTNLSGLPTTYSSCQNANNSDTESLNILHSIQNNFQCSGWCNATSTYFFTPVGGNFTVQPEESCVQALASYYQNWGVKMLTGTWIIFGVVAFNAILALCTVFHPQKKSSSIYQRLSG